VTDPAAVLIVDNTSNSNYFALSPHGFTWLWDEASLRAMQSVGLLTGDGLANAVVLPWETCQHYIEMAWTGGNRVPDGYVRAR